MAGKLAQLRTFWRNRLHDFRHRLGQVEALPQLSLLGLLCGLLTGGVILAFRQLVELPATRWMPFGNSEAFEALPRIWHWGLPLAGTALLIGLLYLLPKAWRAVGVTHVLERLHHHQGHLPLGNALAQFAGGVLALTSGFSSGREGPAVHLGAAVSSQMGQWLQLPHNSVRTLVGCGVAAAIAASFNTPLAGVIFAMEVVLMEYTVGSFLPLMLAAAAGAVVTHLVYGQSPAFLVPNLHMESLLEMPYFLLVGLAMGLLSVLFTQLQAWAAGQHERPLWLRLGAAGLVTAALATLVPASMGLGYDTLEQAILGEAGLTLLLSVVAAKLVITALAMGLGIPGGVIGPLFVIGGCAGGVLGLLGSQVFPELAASPGFYVMLGMGALVAATLNAPLAALLALLELTLNPNLLLPGMVAIVAACVTHHAFFRLDSVFETVLVHQGRRGRPTLSMQLLARAGVTSQMQRNVISQSRYLPLHKAASLLEKQPRWIVIDDVGEDKWLLRPADLADHIERRREALAPDDEECDLQEIPGERRRLLPISPRASLREAWETLEERGEEALFVPQPAAPLQSDIAGVLTRSDIENFYRL